MKSERISHDNLEQEGLSFPILRSDTSLDSRAGGGLVTMEGTLCMGSYVSDAGAPEDTETDHPVIGEQDDPEEDWEDEEEDVDDWDDDDPEEDPEEDDYDPDDDEDADEDEYDDMDDDEEDDPEEDWDDDDLEEDDLED